MEISIRTLSSTEEEHVYDSVCTLFLEMYEVLDDINIIQTIVPGGEQLWMNAIKRTLGKLNGIAVAFDGDRIVGFSAGNLRLLPSYLGNKKVGYCSHLFVKSEYKKQNIGRRLMESLEDWFYEKEVSYIELEASVHNQPAIKFFHSIGYVDDHIRMIKKNEKV